MKKNNEHSYIDTEKSISLEDIKSFALVICGGFTATMLIGTILGTAFGSAQAHQGLLMSLSILGAWIASAGLQFVFFTPVVIKRMTYPVRIALFGICLYAILATIATCMNWFPTKEVSAWISFTISYLVILAVLTAFFTITFWRERRKMNEKLTEYREKHVQTHEDV